jgi:hypothetical protein
MGRGSTDLADPCRTGQFGDAGEREEAAPGRGPSVSGKKQSLVACLRWIKILQPKAASTGQRPRRDAGRSRPGGARALDDGSETRRGRGAHRGAADDDGDDTARPRGLEGVQVTQDILHADAWPSPWPASTSRRSAGSGELRMASAS